MKELLLKIKAEASKGQKNNPYESLRKIYDLVTEYEKNTR